MTPAQEVYFDAFKQSAERLGKLIELEAPQEIIANEAALIYHKSLMAFGDQSAKKLAEIQRALGLLATGFCPECESRYDRLPLQEEADYPDLCPDCRDKFRWQETEMN